MNSMLKNFVVIIRSYSLSCTLNVLGLALAFATAIIIAIQVDYEYGYDRHTNNAERLYRVETASDEDLRGAAPLMSLPMANKIINTSPHLESSVMFDIWGEGDVYIKADDDEQFLNEHMKSCRPNYSPKYLRHT